MSLLSFIKGTLQIVIITIVYFTSFGILIPYLLSAASTISFILGIFIIIILVIYAFWKFFKVFQLSIK